MKKTLIRVFSLLLALVLLLGMLTACGKYSPRKSTEAEATPILTLGEDTVNFEVLYAFFRSRCEKIADFSADYFKGAEAEARYNSVLADAISDISEIYALLDACRAVGIDPYSDDVEDAIVSQLKLTVEGGALEDLHFPGGDYDDFLAYIRENYHMNDAVARLMIRYAVCEELLIDYYENESRYTDDDVTAFFMSDACIRLVWISRNESDGGFSGADPNDVREFNLEKIDSARNYLLLGTTEGDNRACQLTTSPTPITHIGRYTLDSAQYGDLIATAFALPIGGVSDVMDLGAEGFHVLKRIEKDPEELKKNAVFNSLVDIYLYDTLMGDVMQRAATLRASATYTDAYHSLTAESFFN